MDSGSTYSILSFQTWEKLGIKLSDLDTSTIFNITSATSTCANAIAGTVDLFVTLHFLDGQTEVVKHTFLCASQRMALGVNLLGVDFLRHHGINITSTNSLLKVTKRNNLLYQDNSLHDQNISGSLDIPLALSELRESKFDSSQDIEVYRVTEHDLFQHESDLSIIPTKDAIPFDQLDLDHLTPSTARHLKNTLKPYQSIFAKSKFDLGTFRGFEVDAQVIPKPGIRCRQTPRNKILPNNCIENITNYIDAGLFKFRGG